MGNRNVAVCTGIRAVWALLPIAACLLALCSSAAAAGETLYASPDGDSGGVCSKESPCSIGGAVNEARDGDRVSLEAGRYGISAIGLMVAEEIDLGGTVGAPAILETGAHADVHVTDKSNAVLHDMRLEGDGALELESGTAERLFVAHYGVLNDACKLDKGTTLRDSVCWTKELNEEAKGVSNALSISSSGAGLDKPVVLRNVTAIADDKEGNAIHLFSAAEAKLQVDAANVIARSVNGVDAVSAINEEEGDYPEAHLSIVHSDFGELVEKAPQATVTSPSTNGNVSAAPTFLDLPGGDFHVGGDSPTIDGGVFDSSVGAIDLEGHARAQAGCFGAFPVPDMGPYERTATAACPPPPPPPPRPVEPKRPVFRVISLVLNKKTGGGRLLVEVPGAGILSLTGTGVKLVRRTAPAEGSVISLPIQAWAITRVRLAKTGKTKVHLRVAFEGHDSPLEEWGKAVLLRKKTG
jgi:hypothetical protein